MDNISVDADFDCMTGDYSIYSLDYYVIPEVKLFQTIVLQELLNKEETPRQFIRWLHTRHGKTICSLADLNPDFLECMARRLEIKWHLMSQKHMQEALIAVVGYLPCQNYQDA